MLHCKFGRAENDECTVKSRPILTMIFLFFFSKHFQEAKVISSIHKDTHPAKYARCLFKLSEALRHVPGREAEADQRLKEAKDLHFQIIGKTRRVTMERSKDNSYTHSGQVKEEDFDALIHISQR